VTSGWLTSGLASKRICSVTGFSLARAAVQPAWRVTQEAHVVRDGINGARVVDVVGPLAPGAADNRGRYDTIGRTVYFGDSVKVSLAESLQSLRDQVLATQKDADAIGEDLDTYRDRITRDFHARGLPGPGEIPVEWQWERSIYEVALPAHGWWVEIDAPQTMNALSSAMNGQAGQLTLGHVCGDDRRLTTRLAQLVRDSTLDDGTLPLGIGFPSKTAYGRCWAWWNRRADDGLPPGSNEPEQTGSTNVHVAPLDELVTDWHLRLIGGAVAP